jgi:hypothetical protein
MQKWARNIVCHPKDFPMLASRYPNRMVEISSYCKDGQFIVLRPGQKGVISVRISDFSVWVPGEFPYFVKRVR